MRQLLQNVRTGELRLEEVPAPALQAGGVIVRNLFSLISAGTERAAVSFGQQNLLGKAQSRPDLVRRVMDKARTDGLMATYQSVVQRLNTLSPLGYSSAGEVLEVGAGVEGLRRGDMVACAGSGYACHAEIILVPKNLVARLPVGVSPQQAAFTTLGAIALQGIRRAELTPGERVGVIGLGLVGQLTVQILHAYGFPVLGLDIDAQRVEEARSRACDLTGVIGQHDAEALASAFSGGHGLDAVIIAASTHSNDPIELAGKLLRERGRVSVVGDVGMDVPRRLYYDRELDLRVSRSYGPGRYDPSYEEHGVDYPVAYARWTEQRNMEEFLRLVAAGRLDPEQLVTHTFPIERAEEAYGLVLGKNAEKPPLALLLGYTSSPGELVRTVSLNSTARKPQRTAKTGTVRVGLIGAGAFAQGTILPALRRIDGARIVALATATGRNASDLGRRYECSYVTTDYRDLLNDDQIDLVIIATRHSLHAAMAAEALQAGKNVHVEKPLALTADELAMVAEAARGAPGRLHVGFNRRFAPLVMDAKAHFRGRTTPLLMTCRVNAGAIPAQNWIHDHQDGGGRILGEVCHFVDLLHYLAGAAPEAVYATRLPADGAHVLPDDNLIATIDFADGSRGSILYSALGAPTMPKEFFEVLGDGKGAVVDNYRTLTLYKGTKKESRSGAQDKGHAAQLRTLIESIQRGAEAPIPQAEVFLSSLATLSILRSLREERPVTIEAMPSEVRA